MRERPQFLPITVEVDDDALERLAQKKGVAEMVKPGAGEGSRPVHRTETQTAPARRSKASRASYKSLSIELPEYVWKDIKLRAIHRGTSLRHVILTGLAALGVEIADADMVEDGRRQRVGPDAG